MHFKLSHQVAVQSADRKQAVTFYRDVLGFAEIKRDGVGWLDASPLMMYVDERKVGEGLVLELEVEDVEAARVYLEERACGVILWEGAGRACVVGDPFGVRFNLWQTG